MKKKVSIYTKGVRSTKGKNPAPTKGVRSTKGRIKTIISLLN